MKNKRDILGDFQTLCHGQRSGLMIHSLKTRNTEKIDSLEFRIARMGVPKHSNAYKK